jgi:hypothetical protein
MASLELGTQVGTQARLLSLQHIHTQPKDKERTVRVFGPKRY